MKTEEFAVIESGGKQYKVSVGDTLRIEDFSASYNDGDVVTFDKVLVVDNGSDTTLGTPYIDGAKVEALLQHRARARKIPVIRFRSKSRHLKNKGHRQPFAEVKIKAIK